MVRDYISFLSPNKTKQKINGFVCIGGAKFTTFELSFRHVPFLNRPFFNPCHLLHGTHAVYN